MRDAGILRSILRTPGPVFSSWIRFSPISRLTGSIRLLLLPSVAVMSCFLPLPFGITPVRAEEITLQATAGTDRHHPPPEERQTESIDELLNGSLYGNRAESQTDVRQGMGLIFATVPVHKDERVEQEEAGRFFFNGSLGLFLTRGSYPAPRSAESNFGERSDPNRESQPPEAVLMAGENLHIGVRFCPRRICSLLLGRLTDDDPLRQKLTGDRGALGGIHFSAGGEWGRLYFSPYYVPSFTGETTLEELKTESAFLIHGAVEQRENLLRGAGRRNDYGHRLQYGGSVGRFQFGFYYGLEFFPGSSRSEIARLEQAGLGLGFLVDYSSFRFFLYLNLERTLGEYRTPAAEGTAASHSIDGYALRLGDQLQFGALNLAFDLFIPESALFVAGNDSDRPLKSGHILSGKNPLLTPLLEKSHDFRPTPVPCLHDGCRGLEINDGEPGFRNHAATLGARAGYGGAAWRFSLGGQLLQPLQIQYAGSTRRFTGMKKEDRRLYYEFSLRLSRHFATEGEIALFYSRLHHRTGKTRRLVGEAIFLTLNYRLR